MAGAGTPLATLATTTNLFFHKNGLEKNKFAPVTTRFHLENTGATTSTTPLRPASVGLSRTDKQTIPMSSSLTRGRVLSLVKQAVAAALLISLAALLMGADHKTSDIVDTFANDWSNTIQNIKEHLYLMAMVALLTVGTFVASVFMSLLGSSPIDGAIKVLNKLANSIYQVYRWLAEHREAMQEFAVNHVLTRRMWSLD
jgi:hypothetical protein